MTQTALLTGSVLRETLDDRKGELVVERAPASEGIGWIISLELDGSSYVVVTERRIQLRIFKEVNSAVSFIERNNPDQNEIRVLMDATTVLPDLRLPEKKDSPSKPAKKRRKKPA